MGTSAFLRSIAHSDRGRSDRRNACSSARRRQDLQEISALGSGRCMRRSGPRIVADRCSPRDGFARARFRIAARMALVTLSLDRSAWDAARGMTTDREPPNSFARTPAPTDLNPSSKGGAR
jgi:hypothetical protein